MTNVIGYKGTPDERLESWLTLLLLRKTIAWSKAENAVMFKPTIERETAWYNEEFRNYVAA